MGEFIKRFKEWFVVKPKLDKKNHKPPHVKERDIWWCYMGENIGTEISGKGEKFARPVIIFKKLSRYSYFVVPTSTQVKEGSWYVKYMYSGKEVVACLHQAKMIDYRRLHNKLGALSQQDFKTVKKGFFTLYK